MDRIVAAVAVVLALGVTSDLWSTAGAETAASRIVDRTVSCSVVLFAGVRETKVGADSGTRLLEDRSQWLNLASAGVGDARGSFAHVAAGNPLAPDRQSGFRFPPWRLSLRADRVCRTVGRIPFTRSGLTGGRSGQLGDDYDCLAGKEAIVRVRATFRAPVTLRRVARAAEPPYLRAAGTIVRAQLAVRTASGKALAYAEVHESGEARLFVDDRCVGE